MKCSCKCDIKIFHSGENLDWMFWVMTLCARLSIVIT